MIGARRHASDEIETERSRPDRLRHEIVDPDRRPFLRKAEVGTHDADHRPEGVGDIEAAAQNRWIAVEPRHPKPVADDDDLAFLILLCGQPPDDGFDTERGEQRGRGGRHEEALHVAVRAHGGLQRLEQREILERLCVLPVLDIELCPDTEIARHVRPRSGCPNRDEPIGLREPERVDQHGMDDAENRRVGPDGQRERQHRRSREPRCLSQRTKRDAEIPPESAEHAPSGSTWREGSRDVRLPKRLHVLGQSVRLAQFLDHGALRLDLSGAVGTEFFIALLQVLRQLVDDFRLADGIEPQPGKMRTHVLGPFRHGRLP